MKSAEEILEIVKDYGDNRYKEGRVPDADVAWDYTEPANKCLASVAQALQELEGTMKKKETKGYAVVTTDKRGVFFGKLVKQSIAKGTATLKEAQMCIYWSKETMGVLGLASQGPQSGSKVTPIIPSIELNGVTAVMEATEVAVKKWKRLPW